MKKLWTKEEDAVLIKYYSKEGPAIVKRLVGRTTNAVKNRARVLGLIYRQEMFGWTEDELEILKNFYPIEGKKVVNRLPDRTIKTIQMMAHRLGVKRKFN